MSKYFDGGPGHTCDQTTWILEIPCSILDIPYLPEIDAASGGSAAGTMLRTGLVDLR